MSEPRKEPSQTKWTLPFDQDDRRALLDFYSSNQLQHAALAIAWTAALFVEIGFVFGVPTLPNVYLRGLVASSIPPTLFAAMVFANGYFVYTKSVTITIHQPLPSSMAELQEELKEGESRRLFDTSKVNLTDGLNLLDSYYSCKLRLALNYWNPITLITTYKYNKHNWPIARGVFLTLFLVGLLIFLEWRV